MKHKKNDTAPKITALYERLSREDGCDGESGSIQNQKKLLEGYCALNGYSNIIHYTDDGYTGTSFARPAWERLMQDVEAGKIGTIITKDLSRLGRNYLEVGQYTDILFPQKGVRFVAIANGIDSNDPSTSEYAPIMNLVNEWYVKQYSQRMKAAWQAKRIAGEHTSPQRYGYLKDPENPKHWIIDEEAATVIRRMYQLASDGKSLSKIRQILYEEQIEKPSYYSAKRDRNRPLPSRPYDWDVSTIRDILTAKEYIGMTVNRKTNRPSYRKNAKTEKLPPSEWQYIENTQEPIVSEELFYAVQEKLVKKAASKPIPGVNPLRGLVYCADCGQPMLNKRENPQPVRGKDGVPTGKLSSPTDGFECRTYTNGKNHRETVCSRHWVRTAALNTLILESLKAFAQPNINEKKLLQMLHNSNQNKRACDKKEALLRKKQNRSTELDRLIQGAYEANFKGNLTDERLSKLVSKYEAEQERLNQEIAELAEQLNATETNKPDGKQFLHTLRRVTSLDILTPEMVEALVEKVVIHERIGTRNSGEQEIEIYFKFIGKVGDCQ